MLDFCTNSHHIFQRILGRTQGDTKVMSGRSNRIWDKNRCMCVCWKVPLEWKIFNFKGNTCIFFHWILLITHHNCVAHEEEFCWILLPTYVVMNNSVLNFECNWFWEKCYGHVILTKVPKFNDGLSNFAQYWFGMLNISFPKNIIITCH